MNLRLTTYAEFRPTGNDTRGLGLPDRQTWLVAPVSRTRDSGPLEESNFAVMLKRLGGESDTVEVHRFGHWGPGWFEIILIDPIDEKRVNAAEDATHALADYPILCETDFGMREHEAANETWANCYNARERLNYIRSHRSQFSFRDLEDMLGCVRGRYFAGYASELIS